ncbi:protease FtsH subunit HflK [Pseudomonas delhiensis]|uniref:Protein HflK n=1 Tax=Pseudomonas delhiensis TaxID=366289 RepID=A0A239EVS1_9PSED|nr:FtsH protease activity modulator HflK [Pseudomonas delhiensis]SDI53947.1 protease FtsH subunit HflK [Pseudomonas delhiensis]SNS48860.1 protease FtsH subunit HflK [Pseudomonas delhiensis]
MAWNEPGDNSNKNDQDPWGGRRGGGRQGPPDLDEAFRKLQDSLNRIFGGKKPRGGSPVGGKGGGLGLFGIGLAVLAVLWLYNAIYVVDEQEQAVILRMGKYYDTVGPGLNFYFPPIDRRFQENVTRERAYSKQGQMLTEDENIVEVPLTVQYKISNLKDFVLNVDQPEVSLQHATESALRHVAGSTTMDQILTEGREQMATDVRDRLQRFLDTYKTGITVTQVNIQSAAAPREVQEAFDDVIRAREDEQREKNQAEAYANGVVPEARGQAQRIIEEANGYRDEVVSRAEGEADRFSKLVAEYRKAPEVTRERLYLDSMQDVLSQSSKVLVTGQQGQNNLIYLPLDKMIDGRGSATPGSGTSGTTSSTPDIGSRVASDLQQRDLRTRESR